MAVELIALENVLTFLEEFEPYTDPEEYADDWKNLVYHNPVQAYEYLEEYGNGIDFDDNEFCQIYENALNSVYECVLCNEEV